MIRTTILAMGAMMMGACAASAGGEPAGGSAAPSSGNDAFPPSSWRLERLGGAGVMRPASGATLTFAAEGGVHGQGPCNSFHGGVTMGPAGTLKIGPLGATRKACLPATRMDAEALYFRALEAAARYEKSNGLLILLDDKGAELLAFSPVE